MRIVSLVPSLTLTLFDFGLDATSIVGRTPWCIHPANDVTIVPVVGGTKTPNLGKIEAAKPDVVVMDRDENPKTVYEWCVEQGYETFVCHVQHPRDVPDMLRELGKMVKRSEEAETWARNIEDQLKAVPASNERVALPLIWHDPLMAANGNTYAGNMLTCMGYSVPDIEPDGTGYPEVSVESLVQYGITDLFLSSEPHEFTTQEGDALLDALRALTDRPPTLHFIDGEDLTWMGTRTLSGLRRLSDGVSS